MKKRQKHRPQSSLEAALKRGIDDLQSILDWVLQDRPRARARWRREYRHYALRIYRAIGRASGIRP